MAQNARTGSTDPDGRAPETAGDERFHVICVCPDCLAANHFADARDAARYRWLRDCLVAEDPMGALASAFGHLADDHPPTAQDFDEGIDRALAARKENGR